MLRECCSNVILIIFELKVKVTTKSKNKGEVLDYLGKIDYNGKDRNFSNVVQEKMIKDVIDGINRTIKSVANDIELVKLRKTPESTR